MFDAALKVMNRLFALCIERGSSDLHVVVGSPPLLRVDGRLMSVDGAAVVAASQAQELLRSLVSAEQWDRFVRERELDMAHQIPSGIRFRINLHWEKGNPAMAARAIPSNVPTMDDLFLPPVAQRFATYPNGLVLVTGPTGSGKSTALAAMIEDINRREPVNIITLEDPVEFLFESKRAVVRQRQLGQDFLSFSEGLKHILRQDPDVVMIGEMRDLETISTTLTVAETGHLVFATLHTNSAPQTIDRIIDAFPAHQQNQVRSQLALTLRGIISQQLLPMPDGGRIAAREILVNTSAVANLIRENKVAQIRNVLQTSAAQGMTTLSHDLARLVKDGKVAPEVAREYVIGLDAPFEDQMGEHASQKKGWF